MLSVAFLVFCGHVRQAAPAEDTTLRIYEGLTLYINNEEGTDFTFRMDLRDINVWDAGPRVNAAYEMIPFMPRTPGGVATSVMLLDADGGEIGDISEQPAEAAGVRIDRGGFGVVIGLDRTRMVHRGGRDTILISVTDPGAGPVAADQVVLEYEIKPFGAD